MRILMLMSSNRVSGAAEPVVDLSCDLESAGHQVLFVCMASHKNVQPLAHFAVARGLKTDSTLALRRYERPWRLVHDLRHLRSLLQDTDILHCHYSADHWIGGLAALGAPKRVAVVRSRHHSTVERGDSFHRFLYQKLTHHVIEVCGETAKRNAQALRVPESLFSVVYGAVDSTELSPELAPAKVHLEFGWPEEAPIAGYVARLVPKRKHEIFLHALPAIATAVPEARFLLIGRGELESALRRKLKEMSLEERVAITGYREDFLNVARSLSVHVFVREGTDGTCRALLQSMALGVAPVVCAEGALGEIVEDGVTGKVVPPKDPAALAEAVIALLGDRLQRENFGAAARRAVEERFSPERRLEGVLEAYERAIKNRN